MKKINDSGLYFYFAIVASSLTVILAVVSFYSFFNVEKEVKDLLAAKDNISENYRKAYLILRDPQVFAGYEHFDGQGSSVKTSIVYFDQLIYSGVEIRETDKKYLEILLGRRESGSRLGRNTMFYTLLLSIISWALFFFEKKNNAL